MIIIHTLLLRVKAEGVEASRWSGSRDRDDEGGRREENVQSSTRANQMMMKREVTTARDMKLMSGRGRGRWERGCKVRGSLLYCDYYSH